jgi:hypothetical protein
VSTPYPPPGVPVFPAGFGPSPTDFDNWVQATLGFCTNNVLFRAEQHTAQAISGTTFTPVAYDTILEDPTSSWNSGTNRWVVPYTGWYNVTVTNIVPATGVGLVAAVGVTGNSTQVACTSVSTNNTGGTSGALTTSRVASLDYIQGIVWASGAVTLNSTAGLYSTIEITYSGE